MRDIMLFAVLLSVVCGGCYTRDAKLAHRGGEVLLKDRGAAGDAMAAAMAVAVAEANIDSGASEIPEAEARGVLSVEAATALADKLRQDRGTRSALWAGVKSFGGGLVERLPWIGPVVGFAAAAAEWLRRRKAQLESAKASEIVGVLGRLAKKVTPAELANEAPGMVGITVSDVSGAVERANNSEI